MEISVYELLEKPFSLRTFSEKLEIVKHGRLCPSLPQLTSSYLEKKLGKEYTRHFSNNSYKNILWLTGCEKVNKLFCWPCLLFSKESGTWNKFGFSDLNHLTISTQKHEKTKTHIQCYFNLKMFGNQRIDVLLDDTHRLNISQHNEQVKKNREVMKRLIDAVCFLAKQELAFRGHDESDKSINQGNYLEFLKALSEYDSILENHLNSGTVFRGTSPAIQNDLINAISNVVLDKINAEIQESTFVAIMLDETTDVATKSQLSTVLRYVINSEVKERFVGFTDVSSDKTANGIFLHVKNIINKFKIENKLVGQTYDGAAVMSGHLNGLKAKVLEEYPLAIFTHCYAHVLNLVLKQGLNNIKQCKIFFQTLTGLTAFFAYSSKRTSALHEFMSKKLPTVAPTRWNFTSRLVNTVKEYRNELISFFENIIQNCDNWDFETTNKAQGFAAFLNKFDTVFLLDVISIIFSYSDVLYNLLQTKLNDITYCNKKIKEVTSQLQDCRKNKFPDIWRSTLNKINIAEEPPLKKKRSISDLGEDFYRQLFYEVSDNIIMQINTRFDSLDNLTFFQLFQCDKYSEFKTKFPDELIFKLKSYYKSMFDYVSLKNEFSIFYISPEFQNKNLHEVISFFNKNDLVRVFPEIYKLMLLIITIPCTISSVERSFSALKRINTYCRSTQGQDRLNSLSILSVEKELLYSLRKNADFYDNVIEKFLLQNRRMELMYK